MASRPQMNEQFVEGTVAQATRSDPGDSGIKLAALRRTFQFAFLALNVWLGGTFYFWVHRIETGAFERLPARPAGIEGWLPFAGLMNLKFWITTGHLPVTHPAALFLLVAFLAIAFLLRKAFCSWLYPLGTLSEYFWRAGRKVFGRNFQLPRWLDLPLRGLKYLLLGFFAWAVANMPAEAITEFMRSPYGAIANVRMLNFFRDLGETAAIVIGVLMLASVLIQNFWCRYLCPYGALLGVASLFSPLRIRRSESDCIDCAKCARACPSSLPVDKTDHYQVRGMHRMSGVCCRVPVRRRAAPGFAALDARPQRWPPPGVGHGRGNCRLVFWNRWIR